MAVNARDEQVWREGLVSGSPNFRDQQIWREILCNTNTVIAVEDQQVFRECLIPLSQYLVPQLPVFPLGIEFPFHESPTFNTISRYPRSGRGELHVPTFQWPVWNFFWNVSYIQGDAELVNSQWQILLNFFMQAQGSGAGFLFLHPYRHIATNQGIGTGDGTTTAFTMILTYVVAGAQEIIQNFYTVPQIFINGVQQSIFSYNINKYGTITFLEPPGAGLPISWSGQFFYRCVFADDSWQQLQFDYYQISSLENLRMTEVIL